MSPKVLWNVVRAAAARAEIGKLAPHDLRRICACLCHLAGGKLGQIQVLLGHVSIEQVPCDVGRGRHFQRSRFGVIANLAGRPNIDLPAMRSEQ
jgi:integrase